MSKNLRLGAASIAFSQPLYIESAASIVSQKEADGPLGDLFDLVCEDPMFGCDTWDSAESTLQKETATQAISKAGLSSEDIHLMFAGDLLAQTSATCFGSAGLGIPFYGLYGACSTIGEALSLGSLALTAGFGTRVLCATSSHFASAEKEFRFPLGYGNQRPFSATWTVTGARTMGKPQGTYITIEAPDLSVPDEDYHREISEEVAHHLRELIDLGRQQSILVVGLGNQEITADSLGPRAVSNLHMTRHVIREYGLKSNEHMKMHQISGIVPGVMAQTGMETLEIVRGVVSETKPDLVIAVDALAARSTTRLNRTIQITDTGISPGSGVGNHREGLNEENLSVRVIGIGVPTVVDAATIVHDSMAELLEALEEDEQKEFLEEMISPKLYTMFVTPKDVDETVRYLSFTISEGLNLAFSDSLIEEDRS